MIDSDEIVIKLSKTKILLLVLGAFGFVLAGLWLWKLGGSDVRYDTMFIKIISVAAISFFGMCGIYGLIKLFDSKPGLVINSLGIQDNSSAVSGHTIKWADITEIEIEQVQSTQFLLIYVRNPQDYLNGTNRFKKFWMKMNDRMYGTPLSISSNSLQCDLNKLIEIINKKHATQQGA